MTDKPMSEKAQAMYARTFGIEARRKRLEKQQQRQADAEAVQFLFLLLQPANDSESFQKNVEQGWYELPPPDLDMPIRIRDARRQYLMLIQKLVREGLIQEFDRYRPKN